jgi:hypothetical protein
MKLKHLGAYLMLSSLAVVWQPLQGVAQQNSDAPTTSRGSADATEKNAAIHNTTATTRFGFE